MGASKVQDRHLDILLKVALVSNIIRDRWIRSSFSLEFLLFSILLMFVKGQAQNMR